SSIWKCRSARRAKAARPPPIRRRFPHCRMRAALNGEGAPYAESRMNANEPSREQLALQA
ncbi:hypothetical protein LZ189_18330, partial [Rhodovulum sulfidophilum]|nr:hypothetical protein [Rhodovulum sulfidophilum]